MALKRINQVYWLADDPKDLAKIENPTMGTECFVITQACEYRATSDGRWIKQVKGGGTADGGSVDLSDYPTRDEMNEAIAAIEIPSIEGLAEKQYVDDTFIAKTYVEENFIPKAEVEARYRPINYEITNVPVGTIVDYSHEKEIRIFCTDNVKFTKQNVGTNGNPNIYYMTFKAYAPEGAVSFKEGDRGTVIDTMYTFDNDAAGIDKYGRKYSVCWLALASYSEATDTWTYFGANSNVNKYTGWTYVVEWYNADGIMIGTDKIRINLSNKDCHNALESEIWGTLE